MVNQQFINTNNGEPPPPMDESWWQAVLAEEENETSNIPSQESPLQQENHSHEDYASNGYLMDDIDWEAIENVYHTDQVVKLIVVGFNRGGLLVSGDGLHGFVPVSHLIKYPCQADDRETHILLSSYLDQEICLKVIECDQERGRVVFSERAGQTEPGKRKELLQRIQPGDCVHGTVTNLTDFGVFVDLGGVEGLIHVSELSWGRVQHPADVIQLGQDLEVCVLSVDREKARIALSLKRLRPNPWETAEERYFPGQVTEAVVTNIMPYGAFARLEEGLDGLIHVTQISSLTAIQHPGEVLQEGQHVRVQVLNVDAENQRLGLALVIEEDEEQSL